MRRSARQLFGPGALLVLIFALLTLCVPDRAHAEWGDGGVLEDGVYLRTNLGLGLLLENRESILRTEDDVTFGWEVALGGLATSKFAVHGTLFGWSAFDEDRDDLYYDRWHHRYRRSVFSMTHFGFGPGVTVYLGDSGVYLSASGGLSLLWRDIGFEGDRELTTGFGFEAMIGKEWWSDFAGFGLSVGYMAHVDTEVSDRVEFGGGSLGLHFSLSFND